MAVRAKLILASDNTVELCNLRDQTTDALETGATVTGILYEDDGSTQITGFSQPFTLAEVAGKNGKYRGTIPDAASVTEGQDVILKVTAVSSGGATRVFTINATVVSIP